MKKILKTLIVEDHPMGIEGYLNTFNSMSSDNENLKFNISSAMCCETAYLRIDESIGSDALDLVLLDLRLPASKDGIIISGEDIGHKIKETFPYCKIIVLTSISDNFRLNTILKKLNPDGLLVKSQVSGQDLKDAIRSVLDDKPYYSSFILKLLRKQISSNLIVETVDRQILHQLSLGTRTKDLPKIVNLSIGGVERRKRRLKEIFNAEHSNDNMLIQIAKNHGFI